MYAADIEPYIVMEIPPIAMIVSPFIFFVLPFIFFVLPFIVVSNYMLIFFSCGKDCLVFIW